MATNLPARKPLTVKQAAVEPLTAEYAKLRLVYDPLSGIMIWRERAPKNAEIRRWNTRYADRRAGSLDATTGYRLVRIDYTRYPEHRIAWLITYGEWPPDDIDHRNGKCDDNRLSNLRRANYSQNRTNSQPPRTNTSGSKGVSLDRGKWIAKITIDSKRVYLGRYNTAAEAAEAYKAESQKRHGEFSYLARTP
jgi:hypothetical protein